MIILKPLLNSMDDIHGSIEEYNANEKRKISIVLMIWFLICLLIGKVNSMLIESFITAKK